MLRRRSERRLSSNTRPTGRRHLTRSVIRMGDFRLKRRSGNSGSGRAFWKSSRLRKYLLDGGNRNGVSPKIGYELSDKGVQFVDVKCWCLCCAHFDLPPYFYSIPQADRTIPAARSGTGTPTFRASAESRRRLTVGLRLASPRKSRSGKGWRPIRRRSRGLRL